MAVKVGPNLKNPTHDVSFIIEGTEYGFLLDGGPRALREVPLPAQNTIVSTAQGKFGDYEPGITHIEQRTWEQGMGSDDFSTGKMRFFDSKNLYSMIPGKIFPAPQWQVATGIRTAHENMPGDISWQKVAGDQTYVSSTFTVGESNLSADNLEFWIRRVGSPAALTAEIWTDDSGDPDEVVTSATKTVTTTQITDFVSEFYTFDLSAASDLSSSTVYHVVLYSDGSSENYWEVGVDVTGTASKQSGLIAPLSWSAASFSLYYRLTDTDINRKWHLFEHQGAQYAVDERADGNTSVIYMNGERGMATGAAPNTLVDTNNGMDTSWANDQWNGYHILIWAGTGIRQRRLITDSTSGGAIFVSPNWDATPGVDSEYIIYGGPAWQAVTAGTGSLPSGVVTSAMSLSWQTFFAQGPGINILKMQFDSANSPPSHDFDDDGSNRADLLFPDQDAEDGPRIIKVVNPTRDNQSARYGSGDLEDWGTDTDFGTDIKVRGGGHIITNVVVFDGQIHIFKSDNVYKLANDRVESMGLDLGFSISPNNGQAATEHNGKLFFSWGQGSLLRLLGRDVASIGPDRGLGMPAGRRGEFSALLSHPNHLFACLDGGDSNTSSVLVRDNASFGWHEIFRAWGAGKRIQGIYMQTNLGTTPYLWLSVNGDLVYQKWPQKSMNPLQDSDVNFQHESVLTLADIDLGSSQIPKFMKQMNLISDNLTSGIEVRLDVRTDKDIDDITKEWQQLGTLHKSDHADLLLHLGNVKKARFRLRLLTNDASIPPVVLATIMEGFARTPLKYRYPMRIKLNTHAFNKVGQKDRDPKSSLAALKTASTSAERVIMRSTRDRMQDIEVIIGGLFIVVTNNLPRAKIYVATVQFEARDV